MSNKGTVWIVSALPVESRAVRKRLSIESTIHSSPFHYWCGEHQDSGRSVAILVTGSGENAVRHATGQLRQRIAHADALILIGACGALDPRLSVGENIVPSQVFLESGEKLVLNQRLIQTLMTVRPAHVSLATGDIVTSHKDVQSPDEKSALLKKLGVASIDRESYIWTDICHGLGVPCVVMKSVVDTADETVVAPEATPPPEAVSFDVLNSRLEAGAVLQADWLEKYLEVS